MTLLIVDGVDISHSRLVELMKLADQSKLFYQWVEVQFQTTLASAEPLNTILQTANGGDIKAAIENCYFADRSKTDIPRLFDGVGRSYPHTKACYYFFSWIIRDAPQQRLAPLIQRIVRNSGRNRTLVEIDVLATLISKYRQNVKTFAWEAIREVIVDRLEGSRRSIKGHEKEAIVRVALLAAFQEYFRTYSSYGQFAGVEVVDKQIMVGNESFDVSVNLLDIHGECIQRLLVPIKTRETEGGGHSHLFTRDVISAINAARYDNQNDFLIVVIVAKNWSAREANNIREIVDHAAIFDLSPNEFSEFGNAEQERLNRFIESLLNDAILPKGPNVEGRQ